MKVHGASILVCLIVVESGVRSGWVFRGKSHARR
jgi:hypothetical protein